MIALKLNPSAAKRHYLGLKARIQQRARNILDHQIGSGIYRPVIYAPLRNYLQGLLDDTTLEHLITAPPGEFQGLISYFEQHGTTEELIEHDTDILKNLFIDSIYNTGDFDKLQFIKEIDLDTCVYCNRNYIYYLSGMDDQPIKPEIDHFFPKHKYPYLGLSFYNLIPSCQTCNGFAAKGIRDPLDLDLQNPYLLGKNDFTFTYKVGDIGVIRPLARKYEVEVKFKYKLGGHDIVFKLEKLYQQHSDHVLELIVKSKGRYAEAFRRYLRSYTELKFDDFEIDRLILGNYSRPEDITRRPLAKLYQDIGKELKLIK